MTICNMSLLDESQRALLWYQASMPAVRCPEQKTIGQILKRVADPHVRIPFEAIPNLGDEMVASIYHALPKDSDLKRNANQGLCVIDFPSVSMIANQMRLWATTTQGEVVLPLRVFTRIAQEPTGIDPHELIEHPEKIRN